MSATETICQAIRETRLLQFYYGGGTRIVEPHQVAYNQKGDLALSAYWVHGYSESSNISDRWREYLVDEMSNIVVLSEHFSGPRQGYKRAPNKNYHSAICEL